MSLKCIDNSMIEILGLHRALCVNKNICLTITFFALNAVHKDITTSYE
jgi:hypothetical protein